MTVILDLDYTLLDTTKFKEAMEESVAPFGVTKEQFRTTYAATVAAIAGQYDYDFARHAKLLQEISGADEAELRRALEGALERLPAFLYEDSIAFLESLKDSGAHVALLTFGNAGFQEEKVRRLGIEVYFDECIYTQTGKHTVEYSFPGNEESWVFINDNPKEIRSLMELFPKSTMLRVKRENGKTFAAEDDALAVPTFATLAKLQASRSWQ